MIMAMIIVRTISLMVVLEIQPFKTKTSKIYRLLGLGPLTFSPSLFGVWYERRLMGHVNFWQLVIFAAGPWVGALMDSMPRVVAFKSLCVVQVCGFVF